MAMKMKENEIMWQRRKKTKAAPRQRQKARAQNGGAMLIPWRQLKISAAMAKASISANIAAIMAVVMAKILKISLAAQPRNGGAHRSM
jgi:hypothetical protein